MRVEARMTEAGVLPSRTPLVKRPVTCEVCSSRMLLEEDEFVCVAAGHRRIAYCPQHKSLLRQRVNGNMKCNACIKAQNKRSKALKSARPLCYLCRRVPVATRGMCKGCRATADRNRAATTRTTQEVSE